jgi:GTP-binding protein
MSLGTACRIGVNRLLGSSFLISSMKTKAVRRFSSVVQAPSGVDKIRNIAVIAHVDHGKTTLVDSLLRLTNEGAFHGSMDCNELERERGITILSKCTRMTWRGHTLNVVDTPGHADFGGEVERVMSMVDGVLLVVDINEGPKPQTKFVLSKALALKHIKPIVVVNKVDRLSGSRSNADIENEVFDLFASLDPTDEQMEYPTLYGSGKAAWAVREWDEVADAVEKGADLSPVLDSIIDYVSVPTVEDQSGKFAMLVTTIDFIQASNLGALGLTVSGKIYSGSVKKGDFVFSMDRDGKITGKTKVRDITVMRGLERAQLNQANAGDIVSLSFSKEFAPNVTDTLCSHDDVVPIPSIPIDPPLLSLRVTRNDSPLAGQDGQFTSLELLSKRLKREALQNVAIDVAETPNKDAIDVKGRGELQLGILVETMRREGYEMSLSAPNILTIKDPETGKQMEPYEDVTVLVPESLCGVISDKMMSKDAEMEDMIQKKGGVTEMKFVISTRNWLGLRSGIRDMSGGQAVVISGFKEYRPAKPPKPNDRNAALVSVDSGMATYYDLEHAWRKGTMFIRERAPVYTGMVVGEHKGKSDLDINIAKGEQRAEGLRRKNKEEKTNIPQAQEMTLEMALSYINADEQIEITPKRISIRKRLLDPNARRQEARKAAKGGQ